MMKKEILVCNCGSSSLKVDVFQIKDNNPSYLASAQAERLGEDNVPVQVDLSHVDLATHKTQLKQADHATALNHIAMILAEAGIFRPENRLAIGHRVVHGAHHMREPVLINEESLTLIEACSEFAPLHNPANLAGIYACRQLFGVPQVGVFDTAFHFHMPAVAATYALPANLVKEHNIRRYGFHGTSHEFVAGQAARQTQMDINKSRWISLHLGNGASACAILNGSSIDTSMGFTPLEGLAMGTRSGDMDPALVALLVEKLAQRPDQIEQMLNKESGLKGICGKSDMRDILMAARAGDESATLARDVFCYRVRKYIGAYMAALNGAHGIIFTGGIGENAVEIRLRILENLDRLGIIVDPQRNREPSRWNGEIQAANSPTRILVIPTDEEWMIAQKTLGLV